MFTGKRVLVVDDDPAQRKAALRKLADMGAAIDEAPDGPAALRLLATRRYDVVLMDIRMPGMDGYSVARRLRALPQTSDSLLVALTGYGQAEDREKAYAAGFDRHLLKPTDLSKVLQVLQEERSARPQ